MGFAQALTFSIGFVLVLLAHILSIMTHIALGNELIVSKVSCSSIPLLSLFQWIRLSHSEIKIYKKNGKSRGVWVLFSPILLSSSNKLIPTCCYWLKRCWPFYIFLNYYLASPRSTLSHCQEQSFNKTTLFTEVFDSCFDTMLTWSPVI